LNQAGADRWNALTMQWSPWRDEKPTMRARVIAADGNEYLLDRRRSRTPPHMTAIPPFMAMTACCGHRYRQSLPV